MSSPPAPYSAYIRALLTISSAIYRQLEHLPHGGVGTQTEEDYHAVLRALTRAYRHRAARYSENMAPVSSEQTGAAVAQANAGETPAYYHAPAHGKAGT